MTIDHSETYRTLSVRNLPHILRARSINSTVKKIHIKESPCYFDIGCSNGYLTEKIALSIGATKIIGWDHNIENISNATEKYSHIQFRCIDLNISNVVTEQADFVTCMETIEHVGNISMAIENIDHMVRKNGKILYTVPIEVGLIGSLKYLVKTKFFNYNLSEISSDKNVWKEYERSLFKGSDISKFREDRIGWSTHFGFDFRNFESILEDKYSDLKSWTSGTTRFLLITK